ncbi:hypothetical protein SAMN05421774_10859 [Gemmobacter megaterium]|uniref:Phage tail protein C-terminal domain-containing protein n=1 Tax=Gemmobacter megaterium TaxID=1086013 RepID=A0A1N7QAU2_9RHOB|nr:hypothetical protein [Gemmobacter megaterium]GGE24319.1 hypothetical protein GCM10011345_32860 [Gemmobacter megaterium]SIT19975.1 hypothetical protein SAMN05421774_10859 [Gemmobacter megaterium]
MSNWYRTGTIAVTNGNTTVTGTGTAWIANAAVSDAIHLPDGRVYEIVGISSNTTLTLDKGYLGSNASGQTYAIQPTRGVVRETYDLLNQVRANLSGYMAGALAGKFPAGTNALPGVSFAGDVDTGLNNPASNQLGFVAGGTRRALLSNAAFQVDVPLTGAAVTQSSTDATAGRVTKVGDFGWGSLDSAPVNIGSWIRTDAPSGVYVFGPGTADQTDMPPGFVSGNYGSVVVERFSPTFFTLRVMRAAMANSDETWMRRYGNGVWSSWHQVRNTANTTVDVNGFVKSASPIARVGGGADAGQGFAAAGDGAVNSDASGVAITRSETGVYQITGSLGLAQSGWQIEVPRDHNGNRLCHVTTGWADGVLTITVAEPVWDNGLWIAGNPIDVPGGRWVDVRLHEAEVA